MTETLYLLDGTALAYRSHFAFARTSLTSPDGKPTGAAYGFILTLHRLLADATPDRVAVAFDGPAKTFRHQLHPEYKATREKTPDELIEQFPPIKEIVRAQGLTLIEKEGIEADDLIGTLAKQGEAAGLKVFIVSGDKDFAQLVSPQVHIYNIMSQKEDIERLDPAGVESKWGVSPERFGDYLALIGDTSDNIPGVPGVGPKTAVELLRLYGDMEGVLTKGPDFKRAKIATSLVDNATQARLARQLVQIKTDLDLELGLDQLACATPDKSRLKELYTSLGFTSLLAKLADDARSNRAEHQYHTVDTPAALAELATTLEGATGGFAVDTETTSVDSMRATLVGISAAIEPSIAWYVPLNAGGQEWQDLVIKTLKPVLEDPHIPKWGQNLKYDFVILARAGIHIQGVGFDTMIASYCVTPEERGHGLDALSLKYLDYKKIPTEEIIGKGKKQVTMDQIAIPIVSEYACEDADYTARLVTVFKHELQEAGADTLFQELELPLVPVLARMEMAGIRIDQKRLASLSTDLGDRIDKLKEQAFALAGREFNLRSPAQLGDILFGELEIHKEAGLKPPRKTKTGKYSTNAEVLAGLAPHHELPRLLLNHRELAKLKSTYVDALPEIVHPETGRVHTSFNQAVTATGRLSSSDPNLQNIPIRTEEGRRVRACFVPRQPGWKLLALDYSQIELRIMAHLSGDEHLIGAFNSDQDIHRRTAALIMGKDEAEVTPADRSRAKVVNFGILYGMGSRRLAKEIGISNKEAAGFIESYFAALPGVKEWLDETLQTAREEVQVSTIFGRRRRIPEILSGHDRIRVGAENIAVNTPIQGSAADIIKKAMIQVDREIREKGYRSQLVLQVHDELVFDCPTDEVETIKTRVTEIMEGVVNLQVPLKVDAGVGDDWLEAH